MSLLMMHRGLRPVPAGGAPPALPPANATARFDRVDTNTVAASAYYGTDVGNVPYQVYVPSDTSRSAAGILNEPYRVILTLHSSAEQGTGNTAQMTGFGTLPMRLGYGSAIYQNFPFLVICPQKPASHTGPASTLNGGTMSPGSMAFRLMLAGIPALISNVLSTYVGSASHVILTGESQGGALAFVLMYESPTTYAGAMVCPGEIGGGPMLTSPAFPTGSASTFADACAATLPTIKNIPMRMLNSTADTQFPPVSYQPTLDAYASASPANFASYISSAYDHGTIWRQAYLDAFVSNTPSVDLTGTLFPWMLSL
jgi:predicted peptidase